MMTTSETEYAAVDAMVMVPEPTPAPTAVRVVADNALTLPTQLPSHTECTLVPKLFVAVTVKRYHTPFVRLATLVVVALAGTTTVPFTEQCASTEKSQAHFG